MGTSQDRVPLGGFARLVPELEVLDLDNSRAFWCDILGFNIVYERPENRFMFLEREGAQVMVKQQNGRWETGALERPLGRGINFQIFVPSVALLLDALRHAAWPLFRDCHDAWYRVAGTERGSRQFLVQDPDGYLLRFAQDLGGR
ncbi:bleomycin resistance protein [Bradyrhizobium sp. HKCCYLS2038]|uniref:bleomycin resistance protein n=1 Tax=unclassified Bradyrhizobium TaxID=2631580 RepID=UPI003EC0FF3C